MMRSASRASDRPPAKSGLYYPDTEPTPPMSIFVLLAFIFLMNYEHDKKAIILQHKRDIALRSKYRVRRY